jgi:hypothetical protein
MLANNIQRKIINKVNFPLLSFIQPREKRGILIHVMSVPRFEYAFILVGMRHQGLISSNLEGEIISELVYNEHVSFKEFNIIL